MKTYFTWFVNMSTSMGIATQIFIISKIGLHRMVFIIAPNMTKLQKYPYTMNIPYHVGFAPAPLTYYFVP